MANPVYVDVIDSQSYSTNVDNTSAASRKFIVYNLTGTTTERLADALAYAEVPKIGDTHPSFPLLRCQNLEATSVDSEIVEVVAKYETVGLISADDSDPQNDKPVWEVGSTVADGETNMDADGRLLIVQYTEPGFVGPPPQKEYSPTVAKKIPHIFVRARRLESNTPLLNAQRFVGKVNSTDIQGFSSRTLLCTGITGTSNDSGKTWTVSYEFERAEDTWDADLFFVDSETQQVPANVNRPPGNGLALGKKIYKEVDFNQLNL